MTDLGKDGIVQLSLDDANWYDISGADDVGFSPKRDDLEETDFDQAGAGAGDYDEVHTFIKGLKDGSFTISGFFKDDADGQNQLRLSVNNGADVYIRVLWDGTNGHKCKGLVSDYSTSGESKGLLLFSSTVDFNGAWAAV